MALVNVTLVTRRPTCRCGLLTGNSFAYISRAPQNGLAVAQADGSGTHLLLQE